MTDKYELDLLKNAIDYLNEAMKYYQEAKNSDDKARLYKFCILHCVSFAELFIKEYVRQEHELLLFNNSAKHTFVDKKQRKTITLQDCYHLLRNARLNNAEKLEKEMQYLQSLRNELMHYEVNYDVKIVDEKIGELLTYLTDFDEANRNIQPIQKVKPEYKELLAELTNEYQRKLKKAKKAMNEGFIASFKQFRADYKYYSENYEEDMFEDGEEVLFSESFNRNVLVGSTPAEHLDCPKCEQPTMYRDERGVHHCKFCHSDFAEGKLCIKCLEVGEYTEYDCYEDEYPVCNDCGLRMLGEFYYDY